MIDFTSLDHFVTISLLNKLICVLLIQILPIVLVYFLDREVKLSIVSYLGQFCPYPVAFLKTSIMSAFKHLPAPTYLADMDKTFTIT